MPSLFIDRHGVELKLDGRALAIYENDERVGTIPMAPLERLFLKGDVRINAQLLAKLGENGTGVVLMSGRKGNISMLLARPHNDAARRVTQYHLGMDHDFCREFSRQTVASKVESQLAFLQELREKSVESRYELTVRIRQLKQAISDLPQKEDIAAIRGLEGHAAACYFAGLAAWLPKSLKFSGRNRRPPRDPFNVVLSLSYTLLHAETVIALYSAGLDPYIGFYHALDFGRESLACDMVELNRVHIDRFATRLFNRAVLRPEDFSMVQGACMMGKAGRARFYPAYEEEMEVIRKTLAESIAGLCRKIGEKTDILFPQARVRPGSQPDL